MSIGDLMADFARADIRRRQEEEPGTMPSDYDAWKTTDRAADDADDPRAPRPDCGPQPLVAKPCAWNPRHTGYFGGTCRCHGLWFCNPDCDDKYHGQYQGDRDDD